MSAVAGLPREACAVPGCTSLRAGHETAAMCWTHEGNWIDESAYARGIADACSVVSHIGHDWREDGSRESLLKAYGAEYLLDRIRVLAENKRAAARAAKPKAHERTCDYQPEDTSADAAPMAFGPRCGKPASFTTCDPCGGAVCAEHKCRCSKTLSEVLP